MMLCGAKQKWLSAISAMKCMSVQYVRLKPQHNNN